MFMTEVQVMYKQIEILKTRCLGYLSMGHMGLGHATWFSEFIFGK